MDPELLKTFDKLGIPLNEQKRLANVAVDAVFDSVRTALSSCAMACRACVDLFDPAGVAAPGLAEDDHGRVASLCMPRGQG